MEIPVSFSSGVKSSDGFSWARLSFRVQWFVFRWRFVSSLEVARNYLGNYFVPVPVSNSESPVSKSPHCRAKADIRHSLRAWTRFFPSFKISDQTNHLFLLLSLSLMIRVVLELFIDGPLICLYGTADSSDSQSSDVWVATLLVFKLF